MLPSLNPKPSTSPITSLLIGLVALLGSGLASAEPSAYVSIIIDDMGDQRELGQQALALPGPITYAFLPRTPHSRDQATLAHETGKEVMLHQPMQAMGANRLGPGGLVMDMERSEFIQTLRKNLASVPYVAGINNHMGSLLTRHPGHMKWLMGALKEQGSLFFIDSRTTHQTVAARVANEYRIPSRQRDVFLDDDAAVEAIEFQFQRLIKKALKHGTAIGIGHPYPSTIQVLKQGLPALTALGIELVPVSSLLQQPVVRMAEQPAAPDTLVYNQHHSEPRVKQP